MQEQLVSFKTAKLAKEKGLNQPLISTVSFFNKEGEKRFLPHSIDDAQDVLRDGNIYAPTQSLLQRWLREEKGLHIEILLSDNSPWKQFYYRTMKVGQYFTLSHNGFYANTYEEVLEEGLLDALSLIEDI